MTHKETQALNANLDLLKLSFIKGNYEASAAAAARNSLSHVDYLAKLVEGEALASQDRATARRILKARFPIAKTLDQFQWTWPKKINRPQIQNLFRLEFLSSHTNVILLGRVGLGKTHLSLALGRAACLAGHSVLFCTAIDAVQSLIAAKAAGHLIKELRRFVTPQLLILDELGYLPIDKLGADMLFQIISRRYEQGSTIITANKSLKDWPEIFNNDATLTSAILDRLLHHADTVHIEGVSFRTKAPADL